MAAQKHISVLGQDIFDAILQNYGTLEGGIQSFIELNPALNLGLDLQSGQELIISPEAIGDINNKEFYKINASVLNNADPANYAALVSNYDFQNDGDYDFQNTDNYDFN